MSEFQNFICWQEDAVLATTPRDAATLGPGHFQAVHHPLRLRRRRLGDRSGGSWVSEDQIVEVLRGPLRPDGYLFIPVVGGSGTGKSHLVRWVRELTHETSGWESRYLAKNRTSIRRVIEIVIEGLSGPAIDAAREALEAAPAHSESDEVLAERLLDELALLVAGGEARDDIDPHEKQLRAKLERELPDVLRDPVVRRRLAAPGAVIPRLVGLAVSGRREGDGLDDDAIRVVEADFPLSFDDIGDASRGARNTLTQMASVGDLLRAAVRLINEALPAAVKRVFVSGQIDLIEVFRDVRRSLLEQGRELVLFIEDLTVLHGVEREFLDAIVEPPEGQMCNLRVIFAVTEGHFDDLDTIRTRCDDAYWLDAPYGAEGVDHAEALSFLGRYLNSTRLSPATVESAWAARHSANWLPNACAECKHQVVCNESFGVSNEGFGLYPFNSAAVERFVAALSPTRFDPRDLVRELVNRFLLQGGADIGRGAFPSDDLLATFDRETDPIPPLLAAELRSLRPAEHERLVNTLRYWSDGESHLAIAESVLGAFGLEALEIATPKIKEVEERTSAVALAKSSAVAAKVEATPRPSAIEDGLKTASRSHFAQLTEWSGRGVPLKASATNDLRKLIQRTVVQNLDMGPTPLNLGLTFDETRFKHDRDIVIRDSVTRQDETAMLVIERSALTAAAMQGLMLISEVGDLDDPQADQFRRIAATHVENWTSKVTLALSGQTDNATVAAVEGMVLATVVGGHGEQAKSPSDYLEVLFARPTTERLPVGGSRTDKWVALVEQAVSIYPKLRATVETQFGEARGSTGGVRAVRADQLLKIIEPFVSQWTLSSQDPAVERFMRSVGPAVEAEWAMLQKLATEAVGHLDRDRSWPDQSEKILTLLTNAFRAGRLRDTTAVEYLRGIASHTSGERAHRAVFRAVELTGADLPLQERLVVLASDLPIDVIAVSAFTRRAALAIEGIEEDLDERRSAGGPGNELSDVVDDVLVATSRFADAAKGLAE